MGFHSRATLSLLKLNNRLKQVLNGRFINHYGTKAPGVASSEGKRRKQWIFAGSLVAGTMGFVGYTVGKHWTINIDATPNATTCEGNRPNVTLELEKNSESHHHQHRRRKCRKAWRGACVNEDLRKAISEAHDLAQRIKDEVGTPGLSVSVSVDGENVWSEGFGYADVENRLACGPDTVMRIASISKPITMAIVAKLMEAGQLDIDKPVNDFVTSWPDKEFKGEKVKITTRQLVSHLGGIRHYDKSCKKEFASAAILKKKQKEEEKKEEENEGNKNNNQSGSKDASKKKPSSEFDLQEYHIKEPYKTVTDALSLFMKDELCSKPGTDFLYTTHGWSLISAVAEKASGHDFPTLLKGFFKDIDMKNTYMDENDPIIYNRSRFYVKNARGRLNNAPYVDCSYKWAGGGLLSTTNDLNKFGNAMLYSFQHKSPSVSVEKTSSDTTADVSNGNTHSGSLPGYLRSETVRTLWNPVEKTKCSWDADGSYGMGWGVIPGAVRHGSCRDQRFYVSHTGGAIGGSSVLLVLPRKPEEIQSNDNLPQGVVVSMIVNLQSVGLNKTALKIATLFENLK